MSYLSAGGGDRREEEGVSLCVWASRRQYGDALRETSDSSLKCCGHPVVVLGGEAVRYNEDYSPEKLAK